MVSTALLHSFVDDETSLTRALVRRQCHQRWRIMKNHEESWRIMKNHEESWRIMKNHEESWKIMKNHEESWKHIFAILNCVSMWMITTLKPPFRRAACIGKHWSQGGGNIVESVLRRGKCESEGRADQDLDVIEIDLDWFSTFSLCIEKVRIWQYFAACILFLLLIGCHHEGACLFSAPWVFALACLHQVMRGNTDWNRFKLSHSL